MNIILFMLVSSIFNLQFQDVDGTPQLMSQFQGKKILLVNIATGSSHAAQLAKLQQLQQQNADSLVVIAFPSNSFGHESKTDVEIKQFCQSQYGVTFLLAHKSPVTGEGLQSIYHWLTTQNENGVTGHPVGGDFQKFLIDESGKMVGVFSPATDPLGHELLNAIHYNYND